MNGYLKSVSVAALIISAASSTACHGDRVQTNPGTPAMISEAFSTFAAATFKQPADSTPVNFDQLNLVYDVNEDPTAFNALLM